MVARIIADIGHPDCLPRIFFNPLEKPHVQSRKEKRSHRFDG